MAERRVIISKQTKIPPPLDEDEEGGSVRPDLWQENYTDDGNVYYFNPNTGQSAWDLQSQHNRQSLRPLQDPASKARYWMNLTTGDTVRM